jgi:cation:H+ antiporter
LSPFLATPLFLASAAVTLFSARLFARRLDRLGVRLSFPETLIGLLTALAADGPEISAALFSLIKGAKTVGVGVIVGSNTFNIAAMIGVSGLLAGGVLISRSALALEGATGAAVTVLAVAVLLGWLGPALAAILTACVLVPYLLAVVRKPPGARAASDKPREPDADDPTHHLVALIVFDVLLIVAASAGMVQTALSLGGQWHISPAVLGTLVLAPLTSVPNAITGVRLGIARRSTALVGELFNSNTINLAAGVIVPSLFVTLARLDDVAKAELAWLVGMTAVTLLFLARRRGMGRAGASVLIALYGGFVAIVLSSA